MSAGGLAAAQDYSAVQKRLMTAVKHGEISAEQAKAMMAVLKADADADVKGKPKAAKERSAKKKSASVDLKDAFSKIETLVKEGKMTKRAANAKMAALKKQAARKEANAPKKEASGQDGGKKKPGVDYSALGRKLDAAVKAGKLTREQAKAKRAAIHNLEDVEKSEKAKK